VTPKDFAEQLVREARAQRGLSPSCIPSGQAPLIATANHAGWSFVLDVYDHPGSNGETIEHFRLSAKLFPPGRGSTVQDWGPPVLWWRRCRTRPGAGALILSCRW
jgi:hypothetical protein